MGQLAEAAGLMDMLKDNSSGPYSLFVPSDMYLQRYLASQGTTLDEVKQDPKLREVLQYHIISGNVTIDQFYNERTLMSILDRPIRVNNYGDRRLTVQGVGMQARGRLASNGILHYTYGVMDPSNGTVVDVISEESDLSTLLTAAKAAGLAEFLIDQNPITVFAPTNDAFNALGSKVPALLQNVPLLAEVLKYHVIPGTLYTAGIHNVDLHTFEEVDKIHLNSFFGYSFTVDGGHINRGGDDLSATNGVVQKINKVLIPSSLQDQINNL